MRRSLLMLVLGGALLGAPALARAHDAYDDSESHPLRVIAYAVHPIGWGIEWLFMRPLHFLVSTPQVEPVFGHTPHESPFGGYQPYEPQDD